MRCPNCAKFVRLETQDPEVGSVEVNDDGRVTAEVRVVRACVDCSQELKEANLNLEGGVTEAFAAAHGTGATGAHELTVEEISCESEEGGGGRFKKNMIGARLTANVRCDECGKKESVELFGEEAAGAFEEMV